MNNSKKIMQYSLRGILFGVILVAVLCIAISLKEPRNDRRWDDTTKVQPKITVHDDIVTIENLRDFTYSGKDEIKKMEYYDDSFNAGAIKNVYFLVNPFAGHPSFAHTFFTFDFGGGESVAVSVEARKEVGETYSTLKGLLNSYELGILWGSERDFVLRRSVYFDEPLYRYELDISTTTARALFLDLASETNKVQVTPRFYNTITENCTNMLADSANRINPGSVPWTWSRIFTGNAPKDLYKLHLIKDDGKDFDELKQESNITPGTKKMYGENPGITRWGFTRLLEIL